MSRLCALRQWPVGQSAEEFRNGSLGTGSAFKRGQRGLVGVPPGRYDAPLEAEVGLWDSWRTDPAMMENGWRRIGVPAGARWEDVRREFHGPKTDGWRLMYYAGRWEEDVVDAPCFLASTGGIQGLQRGMPPGHVPPRRHSAAQRRAHLLPTPARGGPP